MTQYQQPSDMDRLAAAAQASQAAPGFGRPRYYQPHRGTLILVLGILGLTVCGICGIVAWVMGNNDLRAMAAGHMDPAGRGLTQAGRICGMITTILMLVGLALFCLAGGLQMAAM